MKKEAGKVIEVTHPKYGTHRAQGVRDRLQAMQQAARAWKTQWSEIARECRFKEVKQDDLDAEG